MNDSAESPAEVGGGRWLLLIHQIPPKPDYLRVKIRRRLHRLGAVALKQSVYVLPRTGSALEDFHWLRSEILAQGGEATICEASMLAGITDAELEALFTRGRTPLAPPGDDVVAGEGAMELVGKIWVTRQGVHEDRIASAWLVRRFVDPHARFRFVREPYTPGPGEVRFDMYEAELTHEGDRCTFETLLERLRPGDDALRAVAEVVHDIDLKDDKFSRPETDGVRRSIAGIVEGTPSDDARIERGGILFEELYRSFGGGPPGTSTEK